MIPNCPANPGPFHGGIHYFDSIDKPEISDRCESPPIPRSDLDGDPRRTPSVKKTQVARAMRSDFRRVFLENRQAQGER
jgi:hypothetical protein